MNHNTLVIEIKSTLDKLIDARTSLGYDYIVYGLLLINEDQTRVSNITKALYIDIAAHYETSWSCVEKNIRNTVNAIWTSENKTILEMIFNRTCMDKKRFYFLITRNRPYPIRRKCIFHPLPCL